MFAVAENASLTFCCHAPDAYCPASHLVHPAGRFPQPTATRRTQVIRPSHTLTFLLACVFSLAACSPQSETPPATVAPAPAPSVPDAHSAADSLDWAGYYHGIVPCASCPGIETWLRLDDTDGTPRYELVENYLESADGRIASAGEARWDAGGNVLALGGADEARVLAVSEDHVVFLGAGQDARTAAPAYRLARLESYVGRGQQLLVDPVSIETETHPDREPVLSFDAVINFEQAVEASEGAGHKSLRAHFVLDCATRELEMSNARYYSESFASGEVLEQVEDLDGNTVEVGGDDDPLRQFGERHCDAGAAE